LLAGVVTLAIIAFLTEQARSQLEVEQGRTSDQWQRAEANLLQASKLNRETNLELGAGGADYESDPLEVQRAQLNRARTYFESFLAQSQQNPTLQFDVADAYFRLGNVLLKVGTPAEAQAAHQEAVTRFEALNAAQPLEPGYQQSLAHAYNNLARGFVEGGQFSEAEQHLRKCLALLQELAKAHPETAGYQSDLAKNRVNLAELYRNSNRVPEAERELRSALTDQEALIQRNPTNELYRLNLARYWNNLGVLYQAAGNAPQAVTAFEEARKQFDRLAATMQLPPTYRHAQGQTLHSLALHYEATGKASEAEQAFQQALRIQRVMSQDYPSVGMYTAAFGHASLDFGYFHLTAGRPESALPCCTDAITALSQVQDNPPPGSHAPELLLGALMGRADALTRLKRHAEALADWDRTLQLEKGPMRQNLLLNRAATLAQLGRHAEATTEAKALVEATGSTDETGYNAACVYGAAAGTVEADAPLRKSYLDRAVELLHKLQASGYFKEPSHMQLLKEDKDLDLLRQRPDFKKLLVDLEKK
jgi:tetratricopeptide (TPR) repeat protein